MDDEEKRGRRKNKRRKCKIKIGRRKNRRIKMGRRKRKLRYRCEENVRTEGVIKKKRKLRKKKSYFVDENSQICLENNISPTPNGGCDKKIRSNCLNEKKNEVIYRLLCR